MLTILDMQPRQTGGSSGQSSDSIVYEMAAEILDKLMDKLDTDEARPDMFEVSVMFVLLCIISRVSYFIMLYMLTIYICRTLS